MRYREPTINIVKAGLGIKEFAKSIKANPNLITNLKLKEKMSKNIAVIAVLLGEMVNKGLEYKYIFEKLELEKQKAGRKSDNKTLFKKNED